MAAEAVLISIAKSFDPVTDTVPILPVPQSIVSDPVIVAEP